MTVKHWLFVRPCGCNEAITTQDYRPTKAAAWNGMYATKAERDNAFNRGITVIEITHEQWVNEHRDRHGRCDHPQPEVPKTHADCPECGRYVALTKTRLLRAHKTSSAQWASQCPGGRTWPKSEVST